MHFLHYTELSGCNVNACSCHSLQLCYSHNKRARHTHTQTRTQLKHKTGAHIHRYTHTHYTLHATHMHIPAHHFFKQSRAHDHVRATHMYMHARRHVKNKMHVVMYTHVGSCIYTQYTQHAPESPFKGSADIRGPGPLASFVARALRSALASTLLSSISIAEITCRTLQEDLCVYRNVELHQHCRDHLHNVARGFVCIHKEVRHLS